MKKLHKRMMLGASIVLSGLSIACLPVYAQDSLVVDEFGNVGVGTSTPNEAVSVFRSDAAGRFQLTSETDTVNQAAQFIQRRARSGPGAVQANDNIGFLVLEDGMDPRIRVPRHIYRCRPRETGRLRLMEPE